VRLEQVDRLLGLRARDAEVVRGLAARAGRGAEQDHADDRGQQAALPVVGEGAGEPREQERHTGLQEVESAGTVAQTLQHCNPASLQEVQRWVGCVTMTTGEEPGLRERKRARTRQAIAAAALDLFDRQGFAQTTIQQVAEAADVSARTVSGYFPRKEDLAFPGEEEALEALAVELEERPRA
jgi:hypothetical protein